MALLGALDWIGLTLIVIVSAIGVNLIDWE